GTETALHLDKMGHTVTAVARAFPARAGFKMNDDLLKDLMAKSTVNFLSGTRLKSVEGDVFGCKATVTTGDEEHIIECDTVLLALGYDPTGDKAAELEAIVPVTVIGDAAKAGKILHAVHSAWDAVRNL
ncbi:MAG: FAD-dependent oxidoreductase, partial [Oscillospiraceae bacterium]|nr:FAD-dependent oxidoreductase [Oscillospiraceae bacterium]